MPERIVFGDIEVRPVERELLRAGEPQRVGARAFDLLLALIRRRGHLVTKDELLDTVWPGLVVEEANIQVQVSGLRKLLGARSIATVPGLGYRLAVPLAADAPGAGDEPDAVLEAAPARDHNLPEQNDLLLGRDADVETLRQWIDAHALVTVHGPGGIGKTRVAQAVGLARRGAHANGVWWVDLAAVEDERLLATSIANAARLQIGHSGGGLLLDALVEALAPREALLVLDNCEHLVDAVCAFALAVHRAAPRVRLLVTSQERLKAAGEHVYRLDPLATPGAAMTLAEARRYPAIELLEQRARALDRRFALDERNIDAAIALVRRLDGIPLAIEMAAARVPLLGVHALVERLDAHLKNLRNVERSGVPARQQTLQQTLAWSHALLAPDEQLTLWRLAIFAGSFRMEAAQRVAAAAGLDEWTVLDRLSELIDKSLVQLDRVDPPRYRVLETMRLFALARLAESGEAAEVEQRHGEAMAELAQRIEAGYWQLPDRAWLGRHAADYDDLQLAFDRACARRDARVAALTGNALARLDHLRNVHPLRRRRAEALHALLPHAQGDTPAWIWNCIASHGLIALDVVARLQAAHEAVAAWRRVGDAQNLYFALGFLAAECSRALDHEGADRALAQAVALESPDWPLRRRMWGASAAAGVAIHRGDAAGYRAASRTELALAERAGAERAAAWARLKLADAALMAGEHAEAIALGEHAADELRALDQPSNLGLALTNLCEALLLDGRPGRARAAAREALPLMWHSGWSYLLLDSVAALALERARPADAARVLGQADAWYAAHADQRQPNEARIEQRTRQALDAALGAAQRLALGAEGAALGDAAARALAAELLEP